MILKILLTLIILNVSLAQAFNSSSLTWQKLALEEKVQRKYTATIGSLLKDNQYLIEVEVETEDPGAPNFGGDDKKTGPRVSDLNLTESRGDYIAFSKVGLEVPVVDKFLDEDRTKLMNLYRFNEAYDLFKNLSGVTITVYLSDKIPQDLLDIVKKVITSNKFSVAGVKPNLKFESIAMEWVDPAIAKKAEEDAKAKREAEKAKEREKKKENAEPQIWAKDWLEWASRWGNAVGLVLAALILTYLSFTLFKKWSEFMEKYAAMNAPKNQEQKEDNPEEDKEQSMAASAPELSTQEEDMQTSQGLERFRQCLEQHSDDAITIVRGWLNDGEENSLLALRAIAQQLTAEELDNLMTGLSTIQRDKWKDLLGKHLEGQELLNANKIIFQEIIKSFLVPSRIKDGELLNLIMELNPKSTRDFLQNNDAHIGITMNILSPTVVGKVLLEVDDSTADQWLMSATEFSDEEMDQKVAELKEALRAFKQNNAPSPFAQRLMVMIPMSTPSREGNLYRALAKAGTPDMIMEVASKYFPSELLLNLPGPFLKEVIQSYPVSKRVELLFSRTEGVRESLLDILAETGTPARDLLNMELENIIRDPSKGAAIESRSEEIWQDFVKTSRTILGKNSSYSGLAQQLIKEWLSKLAPGLQAIKGGRAA